MDGRFRPEGDDMTINLKMPDVRELKPHILVFGVGGAGGNAVNNMISSGLMGCEFVVANTDAQALASSKAKRVVQLGVEATQGLGAGSHPEVGRLAAEEALDELRDHLSGAHMAFITAGMGGGTGTGAAPVIARVSKELGLLTVGVVTKPFHFEGQRRMRFAEAGITELAKLVDTLIVIPNQNLFRVANEKTTFADAFSMADQVLYSGVACITDLMVKEGLINLDFADVRAVMREMGKAMMGTGEASGERRAITAAEAAIANPLLDEVSMRGARGLLISITGGKDLGLYEVDEAANRIREEVDPDANIILGATFDQSLEGLIRVSVVATGIEPVGAQSAQPIVTERPRVEPARLGIGAARAAIEQRREAALREASYANETPTAPTFEVDDVTLRPLQPRPSLFHPIDEAEPEAGEIEEEPMAFIPPQAERPSRPQRLPRIEDFPPHAQNQLRAKRSDPNEADAEKKRMTLLERLANRFNKSEPEGLAEPNQLRPAAQVHEAEPRPVTDRRPSEQVSEYIRRPSSRGLPQEAPRAAPSRGEEDELEIPAFLRRQAR